MSVVAGMMILSVLAGCSHHNAAAANHDCRPLLNFIGSHQPGEVKKIELEICWMCGDSLGWKRCQSFGDPAGKAYCQHLLKHAAFEFAQDNLNDALECLLRDSFQPFTGGMVRYHDVSYYLDTPTNDGGSKMVTVRFNDGTEAVPKLTIEVGSAEEDDDCE